MLSDESNKNTIAGKKQPLTSAEKKMAFDADVELLKASYWAARAASAHSEFSKTCTFQASLNGAQKPLSSKSQFPSSQYSKWLLASKPNPTNTRKAQIDVRADKNLKPSQSSLPDIYRTTLKQTHEQQSITQPNESSQVLNSFFEQFESAKASNDVTHSLQPQLNKQELQELLDKPSTENLDQGLLTAKDHWTSKLMNNPKMVASIIGFCLLASSVYAGLGYWWLSSTSVSQAAEPENGQSNNQSGNAELLNIKALQKQLPSTQPNIKPSDPSERLIAQAAPVSTFAEVNSTTSLPELSGRPDPFAPLIQETNGTFIAPPENADVLTGVQYTGFVGGANSKDKIAIIKVADPNPAISPKTVFKKAGESFYINGERIYLSSVNNDNLKLRLKNETRVLALNPYKVVPDDEANTASATTNAAGNVATVGNNTSDSSSNGNLSGDGNMSANVKNNIKIRLED